MNESPFFLEDFEFHHLAKRPFYGQCIEWLVTNCRVGEAPTIVDLGCGSGLLTLALLRRFDNREGLRLVGVDPSEPELKLARDLVADKRVEFVNGTAQNLRRVVNHADAVLMSNVLHQIPFVERSEVFHSVSEVLKPGGIFAFTTLYYEGTLVTETRSFYALWMLKTFGELRRRGMQAGQNHPRGPAFEQLTPAQHRELLVLAGFDEVSIEEPVFQWSLDDWKALSRYSVFIKNTLGDIDLLAGSNALQWGVAAAYEELGINRIARRWLHGVARRAPAKAIRRGVFEEGRDKNPHTEPAGR